MSLSLLLQQCPACLVRLTWIVFLMGGRWPYSCCLVGCCLQVLFKMLQAILNKSLSLSLYLYIYIYIYIYYIYIYIYRITIFDNVIEKCDCRKMETKLLKINMTCFTFKTLSDAMRFSLKMTTRLLIANYLDY